VAIDIPDQVEEILQLDRLSSRLVPLRRSAR
jgi:hypothetical protein